MIYWSDKNPATSDKKICNFVVCYAMLDSLPIFRNHSFFFWLWPFRNFFLHKQLLRFPQGIRKKNNHKLYGSPDQFKQTNVYCDLRVKICLFLHIYKWAKKWRNRAKKKNHFYSTTIGPFGVAHIKTFKHTNWFWSFWQIGIVVLLTSLNCTFLDFSPLCVVIKLQSICPININRPKLSCSIYTIQQFLPYTNDNNQGIYTKIW